MKQYHYKLYTFILIASLSLVSFANEICYAASSDENFNIVLITIDTLRADHLSCYGYERKTSPNIDKIAEEGILFKNAIAPSSWTAPSMVSLVTSTYPTNHGVIHGIGYRKNKTIHTQEVFSDELTTLAEILKANGYTTFGVASNLHLSEKFGFARGFDYFKCLPFRSAFHVSKTIYSWENEIKKSDKFFIWLHYFDPHYPYLARNPWIEQYTYKALTKRLNLSQKTRIELSQLIPTFKEDSQALSNLIALYDSEVSFVDFWVGNLIQKFELDKNTLIIITADHGEEFLEHDQLGHGKNLYQETIHIPLIIKLPYSSEKKRFDKQVNLLDIMPTILHLLNLNLPEQTVGKSLLKREGILSLLKEMFIEKDAADYNFSELDTRSILKTIITSKWKYIYDYGDEIGQLYNIKSDPLEQNDLADEKTRKCNQLREKLFDWVSNAKQYPTKKQGFKLSPEEKEKLKSLGYIQ